MDETRLTALMRWRDAQLATRYGDEGAAFRLRGRDVAAALEIEAPTADELQGTDLNGEPLDPDAPWWGYNGMTAAEIVARRRGKWPPG